MNAASTGHPEASGMTESIAQYGHNAVRSSLSMQKSSTSDAGNVLQQKKQPHIWDLFTSPLFWKEAACAFLIISGMFLVI